MMQRHDLEPEPGLAGGAVGAYRHWTALPAALNGGGF
tara:strand:+ start:390 stop:500 length:111 start_codon:yes stop_codon:yes gene_type:complete